MPRNPRTLILTLALAGAATFAADDWRNLNTETTPELAANEIQFIKELNGELWIGTLSGLTRYHDGEFAVVSQVTEEKRRNPETGEWETVDTVAKAERQICDVLKAGDDTYLVGTAGGVCKMENLILDGVALKGRTVAPVLHYTDNIIWALAKNDSAGTSTVYEKTKEDWQPVDAFADRAVVDVLKTADDRFWSIIDGNGVLEVNPEEGPGQAEHHLQGLNVRTLMRDSQKRVWFGLWGRGVAMMDKDGAWKEYLEDEKSAVLTIAEDGAGNIWVGTSSSGLFRFDGKEWTNHLGEEGAVSLLFSDSAGHLWVSTQRGGGLRYRKDGEWQRSLDSPLPITCMAEHDGALWAGGVLDGIHILDRE